MVLAILSLITAGQHSALIHTLVQHKDDFYTTIHVQPILSLVATEQKKPKNTLTRSNSQQKTPGTPARIVHDMRPSSMMIYVWQTPIMEMAWSVVSFVLGLILHITSPLRHDSPGIDDRRIAIFVLVAGGVASLNFGWCSLCLYRAANYGDFLVPSAESKKVVRSNNALA